MVEHWPNVSKAMSSRPNTGVEYGNRTIFELHSINFLRTPGIKQKGNHG